MSKENLQVFPSNKKLQNEFYDGENASLGMTLRDYFAAKALNGILLEAKAGNPEYFAAAAYSFADAMLKERRKK